MRQLSMLLYDYVPDVLERRPPHREAHLELLRSLHAAGDLVMAGALGDPPRGSALVFRSEQAARDFAQRDPYVAAGLVIAQRVEPWMVVVP